jgi:ABC-type methionine transport system permease subunit
VEMLWPIRLLRGLSVLVEVTIFLLILRTDDLRQVLRLTALPSLLGTIIFLGISLLGVAGLAGRIAPGKLGALVLGIGLILWSTQS